MLYRVVNRFVNPEIREVEQHTKELEEAQALHDELQRFRTELLRMAELPSRPDSNEGVENRAAPFRRLFSLRRWRKALEKGWQQLEEGALHWAHLACRIWPDRVPAEAGCSYPHSSRACQVR